MVAARTLRTCLIVVAVILGAATTARGETQPAQIDRNGTLILIRSSLIALQQANETGNYTVLRDLAAPGFREANDAARLAEIFASLRGQKVDLSGVLALDPQLTVLPQIDGNGMMRMAGVFPSVPTQVNFDLVYAPVNGRWRVFGMAVRLGSSAPVAPNPPPAVAATKPEKPGKGAAKAKPGTKAKPGARKPATLDDASAPSSVGSEPTGGANLKAQ